MPHPRNTPEHTAPGRAEMLRRAAVRAIDDPVKLDRAARIIREALRRERLTLADLVEEGVTDVA